MKPGYLFLLIAMASVTLPLSAESRWYGQIGMSRQSQQFELGEYERQLQVTGGSLLLQRSTQAWSWGAMFNRLRENDGDTSSEVEYQSDGYLLFAELSGESYWLGVNLNRSGEDSRYIQWVDHVRAKADSDGRYLTLGLDSGYQWYFASSQIQLSAGLMRQNFSEERKVLVSRRQTVLQKLDQDLDQAATLASLSCSAAHHWSLADELQLSLSVGLTRVLTVSGEGRLEQAFSSRQFPATRIAEQETDQASAITSQNLMLSLYFRDMDLSFEIDRASNQALSDAYLGATVGLIF